MNKILTFVSHKIEERNKIQNFVDELEKKDIFLDCYFAENNYSFTSTIADKIKRKIDDCELFLVFLTEQSCNSNFVNQEMGYALDKGKKILIISDNEKLKPEGFFYGRDIFCFDNNNIDFEKLKSMLEKEFDISNLTIESFDEIINEPVIKNNFTINNNNFTINNNNNPDWLKIGVIALVVILIICVVVKHTKKD